MLLLGISHVVAALLGVIVGCIIGLFCGASLFIGGYDD